MTKLYETIVLIDAMTADDSIKSEFDALEILINRDGKLLKKILWGKCKLAYSINKRNHAYYGVFFYEGSGELVDTIEKGFSINDNILRWMTVVDNPAGIPADKIEEETSKEETSKEETSKEEDKEVSETSKEGNN